MPAIFASCVNLSQLAFQKLTNLDLYCLSFSTVITLSIGTDMPFAVIVDTGRVGTDQGLHCLLYIQQYFIHIKR